MVLYYNIEGEVVPREVGIALFEDDDGERRRVARDEIEGFSVSTVLLVFDHSFGDGPPLIFETMIFAPKEYEGDLDCWQDRYATKEQAVKGHARAVALVRTELARQ